MADQQPTFQQAMEITAAWLQQWDNEEISDEVLADRIGEMVASTSSLISSLSHCCSQAAVISMACWKVGC